MEGLCLKLCFAYNLKRISRGLMFGATAKTAVVYENLFVGLCQAVKLVPVGYSICVSPGSSCRTCCDFGSRRHGSSSALCCYFNRQFGKP